MKNLREVRSQFSTVNGAKFITVNGYESKSSGEVANHNLNVNISVENAKVADLETLKNFPASQLNEIADKVGASKEDALRAIEELIVSAEKNLSKDKADRTAQSQGQSDAYVSLGKGLRINLDNMEVYVSGFANSKVVIVEGEYKTVNSKPKTLVKKAITKTLKMYKFRNLKLGSAESLTVTGSTIQL
jgi:hypothetical protein